jgi:Ion channel
MLYLFIRNLKKNFAEGQKNVLAMAGNRDEEECHFYREMEAKRIQKGIRGNSGLGLCGCLKTDTWSFWKFFFHDVIEYFFVQKIFGYGVHPFWLFGWWLALVVAFAVIYSIEGGIEQPEAKQWYDYLWFSIATAATPGYALYKPVDLFKFVAGIEAILGTFMWAAFITTFARDKNDKPFTISA